MGETETASTIPDPRTAEVLRAVQRARVMVANASSATPTPAVEPSPELLRSHGVSLDNDPAVQEVAATLLPRARDLENALLAATKTLADFQRTQDRAVRELADSVQGLKHQATVLAGCHRRLASGVAAWGVILGLLVSAAVALSWRTHAVALSTHAVLEQILENQVRLQAAKGGKRR